MRLLAVDAATEACSVALLADDQLLVRSLESGKSSAPKILKMAEEVLAEAQFSLSMLDGIAASIGPGSFTGVRISVAVAQGLAFGAGLKAVPVTTLEALALEVLTEPGVRAVACLDARMGEVYWGCFAADAVRGVIECGASGGIARHRGVDRAGTVRRYRTGILSLSKACGQAGRRNRRGAKPGAAECTAHRPPGSTAVRGRQPRSCGSDAALYKRQSRVYGGRTRAGVMHRHPLSRNCHNRSL